MRRWRFQEPVDVLKEEEWWFPKLEESVDLPPKHPLLPDDAGSLIEGFCDGIVLAREATDKEVKLRQISMPALNFVEDLLDVVREDFVRRKSTLFDVVDQACDRVLRLG